MDRRRSAAPPLFAALLLRRPPRWLLLAPAPTPEPAPDTAVVFVPRRARVVAPALEVTVALVGRLFLGVAVLPPTDEPSACEAATRGGDTAHDRAFFFAAASAAAICAYRRFMWAMASSSCELISSSMAMAARSLASSRFWRLSSLNSARSLSRFSWCSLCSSCNPWRKQTGRSQECTRVYGPHAWSRHVRRSRRSGFRGRTSAADTASTSSFRAGSATVEHSLAGRHRSTTAAEGLDLQACTGRGECECRAPKRCL